MEILERIQISQATAVLSKGQVIRRIPPGISERRGEVR